MITCYERDQLNKYGILLQSIETTVLRMAPQAPASAAEEQGMQRRAPGCPHGAGNDLGGPLSLPWLTPEQARALAHENSEAEDRRDGEA
jgi:hypothetical protein